MDYFVSSNAPNTFHVDDELQLIPNESTEIFGKTHNHHCMWSIEYQGILLNTHFFSDTEIEFDVNPSDVKTADNANHVVAFMTKLAQITKKSRCFNT